MPRFRPPCRVPDSSCRPVGRKCCPTGVAQAGLQPCAQRGTMECSVGGMVSTQCLHSRTFRCKERKRHPASRERHCDSVGQLKGNNGSTLRRLSVSPSRCCGRALHTRWLINKVSLSHSSEAQSEIRAPAWWGPGTALLSSHRWEQSSLGPLTEALIPLTRVPRS